LCENGKQLVKLIVSKAHGFELVQIVSWNLIESHLSKRKETCIELL